MNPANPVSKLLQSSKFLIVLIVSILTFVGVFKGAMTWKDANDFLRWVIGPWLLAQGLVDASKNLLPSVAPTAPTSSALPPAPPRASDAVIPENSVVLQVPPSA